MNVLKINLVVEICLIRRDDYFIALNLFLLRLNDKLSDF